MSPTADLWAVTHTVRDADGSEYAVETGLLPVAEMIAPDKTAFEAVPESPATTSEVPASGTTSASPENGTQ